MPSKRKGRKRTTSMSGLATTLLRDKIAPFDTPESQNKFGELIAGAARPAQKLSPRRRTKTFTAPKEKGDASRPKVSAATLAREANHRGARTRTVLPVGRSACWRRCWPGQAAIERHEKQPARAS